MLPADIKLISVDDHVVEPPTLWTERLPSRYKEIGPRVEELPNGRQAWVYEDIVAPPEIGMVRTIAGVDRETLPNNHVRFDEMRPGCFDPKERLVDMDTDGVWAELAFPTFARFAGHRFIEGKDRELSALCVQAYNDYILEEWCATDPERLLPMAVLPFWDVERSIAEVRRVAALGAKAIAFSENPTYLGLPSVHRDHWEPLWAAIEEVDLPICMHIASGTKLMSSSDEMPWPAVVAMDAVGTMLNCTDWLYSGVFDRFPKLRIILSEGGAGWVPYVLERIDKVFDIHRPRIVATTRPIEAFREHVYVCIVTDEYALGNLDRIGVDNVLWESDYPHNDSMWPDSRTVFENATAHLDAASIRKVGETNARRILAL